MINLFVNLLVGSIFHFGDAPDRKLIKSDDKHYVAPEGRHSIHPHVAVISDPSINPTKSIYDQTEGDSNDG